MTPRTDNTVIIPGRPPAVTDKNGAQVFCAAPLRARRESAGPGGAAVAVLAPCSNGTHLELCRVMRGGTVESGDGMPFPHFIATHSDAGVRIDCPYALEFWCFVPRELLLYTGM